MRHYIIYFTQAKAALIGEGEDESIHVGGSFALTQKWKHNLIKWNEYVTLILILIDFN